jgi:hypothetical protein
MDLYKTIQDLREERERIDRLIANLEGRQPKSRRGRKSMGDDEKQEVSRRMKAYWAARRMQPPDSTS